MPALNYVTGGQDHPIEIDLGGDVLDSTEVNRRFTAAYDSRYRYAIPNARDIQFAEARAGSMLLGKNLSGTLPLGPWLTTLDEIEDLTKVELKLQVDGETRQHDVLGSMLMAFPELIAYWSRLGLHPGDLVLSGTPSGVGIFRAPPEQYLVQPGHTVTCCSAQLGELTITIGDP